MRSLLTILALTVSASAFSAVECEKTDGRWYPKNELAVKIASELGVKTCSGKKFKAVVEALGETSNVVKSGSSNKSVEEVVASIKK